MRCNRRVKEREGEAWERARKCLRDGESGAGRKGVAKGEGWGG